MAGHPAEDLDAWALAVLSKEEGLPTSGGELTHLCGTQLHPSAHHGVAKGERDAKGRGSALTPGEGGATEEGTVERVCILEGMRGTGLSLPGLTEKSGGGTGQQAGASCSHMGGLGQHVLRVSTNELLPFSWAEAPYGQRLAQKMLSLPDRSR